MTYKTIAAGRLVFTADVAINHKFSDENMATIKAAIEDAINHFSARNLVLGESKIEIMYEEVKK